MKVFVLFEDYNDCYNEVLGVFSTEQKADEECERIIAVRGYYGSLGIQEFILDEKLRRKK